MVSDLSMYEALASAALRANSHDARRLRKSISHFEQERERARTDEHRAGFDLVLEKLRERLGQDSLPFGRERGE